jgi:tetratricopeptide (TPR) repeat protein
VSAHVTLSEEPTMISREMCILLDDFRTKKNTSMIKFTDGVVSLRQYKRYLYGTSEMPFKMFVELCERISLDPMFMVYELERKRIDQINKIDDFNKAVIATDYGLAEKLMLEIRKEVLYDRANEIYFQLNVLLMEYQQKKYPNTHFANACAQLIHYPDILRYDMMNGVEITGLSMMLNFLPKDEILPIMDKLLEIINKQAYSFLSKDFYSMNYVRLKLAKEYGIMRKFEPVIDICHQVLKDCEDNQSYFNMDLVYYYLCLSYKHLNDMEKAHHYIEKLYYVTKVKLSDASYHRFNKLIEKDFGFDFDTLLSNNTKKY